jgi:hypothetical protein
MQCVTAQTGNWLVLYLGRSKAHLHAAQQPTHVPVHTDCAYPVLIVALVSYQQEALPASAAALCYKSYLNHAYMPI